MLLSHSASKQVPEGSGQDKLLHWFFCQSNSHCSIKQKHKKNFIYTQCPKEENLLQNWTTEISLVLRVTVWKPQFETFPVIDTVSLGVPVMSQSKE